MARRRQSDNDDGLIDILFEISKRFPIAGLTIGALFVAGGVWLTWVSPRSLYGLRSLFGFVCFIAASLFCGTGLLGLVRQRLDQRKRSDRLESTVSLEDLLAMNWRQFEQRVADVYHRQGYRVREVVSSVQLPERSR